MSIRQSRGLPVPPHGSCKVLLTAIFVLLVALAGCGDEGVAEGATVTVYASAPLCAEAKRELVRSGDRAGDVRVRVLCLEDAEDGRLDLAAIGGNARRAVQDSRTVAYIGEPTPAATRFSAPIFESADIAQLSSISGGAAMSRLLGAISNAGDSASLRESVQDTLAES